MEIEKYQEQYRAQLLTVWERSVLTTHDFLLPLDFEEIKTMVRNINFNDLEVYCLLNKTNVIGFVGVAEQKIEMLFLDPDYFGLGYGKKLVDFVISKSGANRLDVNEQNVKAKLFYEKLGFEVFERTEKDDQGRDYPLLRMRIGEE